MKIKYSDLVLWPGTSSRLFKRIVIYFNFFLHSLHGLKIKVFILNFLLFNSDVYSPVKIFGALRPDGTVEDLTPKKIELDLAIYRTRPFIISIHAISKIFLHLFLYSVYFLDLENLNLSQLFSLSVCVAHSVSFLKKWLSDFSQPRGARGEGKHDDEVPPVCFSDMQTLVKPSAQLVDTNLPFCLRFVISINISV